MLDVTDLAHPRAGRRSCRCTRPTTSTWPGPTPTSRPARRAWSSSTSRTRSSRKIDQVYNAGGCINDLHDVKLGITYVSEFAYLADGKNGLRVVQLTSPETPGNDGFSPRPTPQLIATYKLPQGGHALAISKGLDRDRAVDESGNQIGVFGRVGARPLNLEEQRKMYLHNGKVWKVSDDPRPDYHLLGTKAAVRRAGFAPASGMRLP